MELDFSYLEKQIFTINLIPKNRTTLLFNKSFFTQLNLQFKDQNKIIMYFLVPIRTYFKHKFFSR